MCKFSSQLGLGVLLLSACADVSNRADVYEEQLEPGLDQSRTHAYRITLFEYSMHVGGFIEFFEIDGVTNTHTNPYFDATWCDYFGSGRMENDEFPIETSFQQLPFLMTVNRIDKGERLIGRLTNHGGTWDEDDFTPSGVAVDFQRADVPPQRSCEGSPPHQ